MWVGQESHTIASFVNDRRRRRRCRRRTAAAYGSSPAPRALARRVAVNGLRNRGGRRRRAPRAPRVGRARGCRARRAAPVRQARRPAG